MNEQIPKYDGPIAVLDILGFKDFVSVNSLDTIINEYARLLTGAELTGKILKVDLEMMVYSDTIAIRLVNMTDSGFFNFINALHMIIHSYFYQCQIPGQVLLPLRGAISLGEYTWHKGPISTQIPGRDALSTTNINFIAGRAILDAHDHESKQEWISISMDSRTEKLATERYPDAMKRLTELNLLVRSEIPIKNVKAHGTFTNPMKKTKEFGLVVNPLEEHLLGDGIVRIIELFESKHADQRLPLAVKLKYKNTQKFIMKLVDNDLIFRKYPK